MTKQKRISTQEQEARIREAVESLRKIQEQIAPYVKPRTVESHSTAGTWHKPPSPNQNVIFTRHDFYKALTKTLPQPQHSGEMSET